MPERNGDLGLRVFGRTGAAAEWNPQSQEACFELETGNLEQLGRLAEIDSLVEVVTENPSVEVGSVSAGDEKGEGPQEPVIQGIQKDDALLSLGRDDCELSLLHSVEDLASPLRQVGRRNDGPRHCR